MKRVFGVAFSCLLILGVNLAPVAAHADTISVTQIITVTATVLPARSIVVNDQGQMIKIYSNTSETVPPKVYLNKAPGPERALTPELQTQYQSILKQHKNLVGVAIDVPLPAKPLAAQVRHTLGNVSVLLKPFIL